MIKQQFQTLLEKEMDRKQFLKHVGVGVALMTGAATILKTLNGFSADSVNGAATMGAVTTGAFGYGTDAYGGGIELGRQAVSRGTYS